MAAKNDLYVASKGTSGLVNDFGAGIPTRLSLINAKTDSDHMRIGVKQIYQGSWNPVVGFTDYYSNYIWSTISDPASFRHPYTGEILPHRTSWTVETAGLESSLTIPNDAIYWNVVDQKWSNVDSNAMGDEISDLDSEDMVKAARSCLDDLISKPAYPLEFGYANSKSMNLKALDLANGGIGVLCLRINGTEYHIGWSDSNNMENGVREFIVNNLSEHGYNMLETCTSDTHFSHKLVRTRQGYHQFGLLTQKEVISEWYLQIAKTARDSVQPASFEVLEGSAQVSIMGSKIFTHFRMAVSNSLKLTAIHASASLVLFITSFFL